MAGKQTLIEKRLGAEHPVVITALQGLATVYIEQKKETAAEKIAQRIHKILVYGFQTNDPLVALAIDNLNNLYQEQRHYDSAMLLQLWSELNISGSSTGSKP